VSQLPPLPPSENDPLAAPSPSLVRRRPASVQLRQTGAAGATISTAAAADDQSTQALGDALRIVYRFLQIGMVVLVVVFLFSGLKSVKEGERGIRVAFGKAQADDLTPGFQISLPQPLGDILRIDTGNRAITEDNQFWQAGSGPARYAEDAALARGGRNSLDPVQDGFLLTGDVGIGHVVVRVEYGRDPAQIYGFARSIHPDAEQRIVLAAVRRGIVRAAASVTIDQFRKESVMQAEALRVAQQSLDELKAGLQIRSFDITRRMVPAGLINKFNEVESSVAAASKMVTDAEQNRQAQLAETAGSAADEALTLIDRYDSLYTSGKSAEADAVLTRIDALLAGTAPVEGKPNTFASGKATQTIESARADRTRTVSRAQGDAATFAAKRAAFLSNPGVVLLGDWADAFASFVNRDTVQVFMVPPNVGMIDLNLNRDQDLLKEQEQKAAAKQAEDNLRKNAAELRKQELKAVAREAGGS
jgi:regulator of protease activity HflC (stomatin/prohibitin superfamily)